MFMLGKKEATGCLKITDQTKLMVLYSRPLKGRNILGCSGAVSLHFLVVSGINWFQINETGFETGFQSKVLKKSRTLRLKPVSDS